MDKLQMAKALLVTEENAYTKGGQTVTAYGIAVSDSVDGLVRINLGGDTVSPEDDQAIEVETTFSVKEGDEVIVSLIGADGTGKTPIVIGVIGRMDELERDISRNYSLVLNEEYSGTDCTITALIYHYSDDITDDYEPRQFVWYKKTEDGKTALGTGKSITVSIEDMGYGGVIRCEFSSYLEGGYLTTYDGRVITLFDDTPIVVADVGDITLDFNLAQEIAVYDSENRPIAGIDKAANEAYSMAELTPQHFFHNSQGAFVTSDDVKCDTFTGDGIVTGFTLSGSPYNNSLLALYVAGASVISGYSVSGTVLTFDSAPSGSIVALWVASEMQDYAKMDSDSFDIVKATDTVASFGREVTVGSRDSSGAVGLYSQVFGQKCVASAPYSRASGFNTIAASAYQSVSGRNNTEDDTGTYAEIVGNGEYPNETEEFTTDGETINFSLQHEPTAINNFSVGGGINLASDVSNAQMNYTSDSQFTTVYYDVTFSKSFDYDVPLKITINGTLSYYNPPTATTQTQESKTVNFNGVLPANSSTLRVEFWKQLNSQFRLVGYHLGTQTFHSVNVVYTDGYTVNGTTLTLTNEASYWAQTFSGLTVAIDYTYEGTVNRSNARTLDWDGNEKLAGEIDASVRTATVDGYSGALHLYRFGRVVFLSTDDFKSKSESVTNGTVLTQVIPEGFRPIHVAVALKPIATSTNNAFFEIGTDGSITFKGSTSWANDTTWSGTWITGDD